MTRLRRSDLAVNQLNLFGEPEEVATARDLAFERFHAKHPHVYAILLNLALASKATGRRRGIRSLWEVMRWELDSSEQNRVLESDRRAARFLNDHYHSRYARLLMQENPELRGFFEIRELRT